MRLLFAVFALLLSSAFGVAAEGHAHNDYEHQRPLIDALNHGFTSIEADTGLKGEELLIGHDQSDLRPDRTLQRLYLDPLRERGASAEPIILLIDIKSDGETTYRALSKVLASYAEMLTRIEGGKRIPGVVTAIVSGSRPKATMQAENPRYAFYDGRLTDLGEGVAPDFMPLVSDNWSKTFSWRGDGEMPAAERQLLDDIVARAHAAGYRLRFWETPDHPGPERDAIWQTLEAAGVDFINTDDLLGLETFLTKQ